ncbi:MAG: branched-chain amino acid ABC transporter permease [Spirochaetota bacterium]
MLQFLLLILIYTGLYALLALGQNIITGYTGMLSLCQAGFFAIGSYVTAILTVNYGVNFWVTIPIAGTLAAVSGLLVGLPTLRLKGDYLAIATLGFGEIIRNVLLNWDSLTNGPMGINGIPMPTLFGLTINPYNKWGYLVLVWIFVLFFFVLLRRLTRSRMGRALEAIREDEVASLAMGINVTKYKVWAFIVGAFVAGCAGSLQATFTLSVTPNTFTFMVSVMVLCMVVLGGMGNHKAVIFGALIIQLAAEFPRLLGISGTVPPQFKQILFGVILVFMMVRRPQGIIGRAKIDYEKKVKQRGKIERTLLHIGGKKQQGGND